MKQFILGIFTAVVILLVFNLFSAKNTDQPDSLEEGSSLIISQINNVSKLVVSEGFFSQVFNYKTSKQVFGEYLTLDKSALVVVNAEVIVSYDLEKLKYSMNEEKKTINIEFIPEEEIKILPDIQFYDIQSGVLNPFNESDYNAIQESAKSSILTKVNQSNLKSNAQKRLLVELSSIFVLTKSLNWTLQYNQKEIIDGIQLQNELNKYQDNI